MKVVEEEKNEESNADMETKALTVRSQFDDSSREIRSKVEVKAAEEQPTVSLYFLQGQQCILHSLLYQGAAAVHATYVFPCHQTEQLWLWLWLLLLLTLSQVVGALADSMQKTLF